MDKPKSNISNWIRIAQVAGAFAFIISMLLIVNYIQYKNIDPVNTELINNLITRLNKNADDAELRDQIRELDLLARKAYFTNQWQVRTGGYLLLICITVLIIALQIIKSGKSNDITIDNGNNQYLEKKNARIWISVTGIIIVLLAITSVFLSNNELSKFNNIQQSKVIPEVDKKSEIALINDIESSEFKEINTTTVDSINKLEESNISIRDTVIEKVNNQTEEETSESRKNRNEDTNLVEEKVIVTVAEDQEQAKEIVVEKTKTPYPSDDKINKNHPAFRGPGSNGISYSKNTPVDWNATSGKNILWKLEIPLHGYNSPIIWDDKIFLSGATADKREVYCINRKSGSIIWTYDVTGVSGSPVKSPEVTDDTGLAAPGMTTNGNSVFAIFGNGDLVALDMDGNKVWSRNLGPTGNHYGHSSSLILFQDKLILQYDTKTTPTLMGLSVTTGETIWSTDRNVKISWASPVCVNTGAKNEVIIAADPIVASYDPITGDENWEIDCIFGEVGPSVAYSDGIVFAVNEYAKLAAIKIGESPEILWEDDEYLSDVPSPVATNELLIMATSYGVVVCYNSKTGEKYWEQEFDNGFYSSPMLADNKIYLMDMQGITHIMKAGKQYELMGEAPIGESAMTTPAFSDGRVYIRGNKHLFCIGE
jgi:outer membrane protein assembly factor BamB